MTPVEYSGLQDAFDHFNGALFDARHELALNPDGFIRHTDEQICQTLVHEMTHVWQQHCGSPPARGYHDKEWSAKMKAIGLMPSSTGMVGGKETGAHMSDYIIPDGIFSQAYAKLAATGWKLNLQSASRQAPKGTPNSKTKFTCGLCGYNLWGKPPSPTAFAVCGTCSAAAGLNIKRFIMHAADAASARSLGGDWSRQTANDLNAQLNVPPGLLVAADEVVE
jgi:SprT-like family protein